MTIAIEQREICKRCGGSLFLEYDIHGYFFECLQCGATHEQDGQLKLRDPVAEGINLRMDNKRVGYGGHHNRSW